jgi:hypothetical protein
MALSDRLGADEDGLRSFLEHALERFGKNSSDPYGEELAILKSMEESFRPIPNVVKDKLIHDLVNFTLDYVRRLSRERIYESKDRIEKEVLHIYRTYYQQYIKDVPFITQRKDQNKQC